MRNICGQLNQNDLRHIITWISIQIITQKIAKNILSFSQSGPSHREREMLHNYINVLVTNR